MGIFSSQYDRVRPVAEAYAGAADDPAWRTPALAAAAAAAGLVAAGAVAAALPDGTDTDEWGEGWDAGWEAGDDFTGDPFASGMDPAGEAWTHRSEYVDAGVGGDGDAFYFIDGDSSLLID